MITPASTGLSPPAAGGVPYTFTEGRAFTGSWRGTSKDAHPTRAVKSRAQAVGDLATITVENDVRDMETLRAHFGFDRISLLGYSVYGMEVVLYAVEHPTLVQRVVQLGPVPLRFGTGYPRGLDNTADRSVFDEGLWKQLEALRAQRKDETEPREYCRSEMEFFGGSVMKLDVPWSRVTSGVTMPVLTIHGGKDRNAPYGAGREWASHLRNARLLTIDDAAHQSWVDDSATVPSAIDAFLDGHWPKDPSRSTETSSPYRLIAAIPPAA